MAGTPTVYVICDQNCKFEGMTKEQILTAIMQAVESGEIKDVDAGFITTIKTINGAALKFFVGEQSEYAALTEDEKRNLFAIITNDTTREGLLTAISNLQTATTELESRYQDLVDTVETNRKTVETEFAKVLSGETVVAKATSANRAESANTAVTSATAQQLKTSLKQCDITESGTEINLDANSIYVFRINNTTAVLFTGEFSNEQITIHTSSLIDGIYTTELHRHLTLTVAASGVGTLEYVATHNDTTHSIKRYAATCYYKKISS